MHKHDHAAQNLEPQQQMHQPLCNTMQWAGDLVMVQGFCVPTYAQQLSGAMQESSRRQRLPSPDWMAAFPGLLQPLNVVIHQCLPIAPCCWWRCQALRHQMEQEKGAMVCPEP